MALVKHPIAHIWIKNTLVPFLYYAFVSTLPYPTDISATIQQSIEFCLTKPDHPSDGDDLIFERIFMAIMHRHKNLAPDLEMVVDHLEPLAKYLIRRAQIKGPYDLLARTDIGTGAWVAYERQRLASLIVEAHDRMHGKSHVQKRCSNLGVDTFPELRPVMRPAAVAAKLPPAEDVIDSRLVYTLPGEYIRANLPEMLTPGEDAYYRRRNEDFSRSQQQQTWSPAPPVYARPQSYRLPGRDCTQAVKPYDAVYHQSQQVAPNFAHSQQYTQQYGFGQPVPLHSIAGTQQLDPQMHTVQPAAVTSGVLPPSTFPHSWSAQQQSYGRSQYQQHAQAYHQSTQGQSSQYVPYQHPSSLQQTPVREPIKQPLHYPQVLPPTSNHAPSSVIASQPAPPPIPTSSRLPSSDFAHLRGADWSNAAQQRAREIASKITAQERDVLAQAIMRRQESVAHTPLAHQGRAQVLYSHQAQAHHEQHLPPFHSAAQIVTRPYLHSSPVRPHPATASRSVSIPTSLAQPHHGTSTPTVQTYDHHLSQAMLQAMRSLAPLTLARATPPATEKGYKREE